MSKGEDRFWSLFIIWSPFVCLSLKTWWDFTNPRVWETVSEDPHFYAWGLVPLGVLDACLTAYIAREVLRPARGGRVSRLLVRAEALIRQGRLEEAEVVLAECRRLAGVGNDQHLDKGTGHGNVQ